MSGLCGLVDFSGRPAAPEPLRRMAVSSAYRGVDGIYYRFLAGCGLAHLALHSTGEEPPGGQPFLSQPYGLVVVTDSRLDNRRELIRQLDPPGCRGRLASDAEIILQAYLRWETECPRHLLGDFSFALWDSRSRRLLCAVDPLGVKPFHHTRRGSLLCFASDAFQLLQHPAIPNELDEVAVADYLTGHREDPERSFFRGIHRLPPGHRLIATPTGDRIESYWNWQPRERIHYRRREDYTDQFRHLFECAVVDRLRTQAQSVGVAMSGGLDSCSVAAVAHRSLHGSPVRLLACSLAFPKLASCDERDYSKAMSDELNLGVEHFDAEQLWALGEGSPPHCPDTPFIGWQSCYAAILESLKAAGTRVLLTGHGGDDLLKGSPLVYADRLRRGDLLSILEVARHARVKGEPIRKYLSRLLIRPLLPPPAARLLRLLRSGRWHTPIPDWISPEFARRTQLRDRLNDSGSVAVPKTAWQQIQADTVGTAWYTRAVHWHDRNAAAFGIEARHPFLDRRLFEFVLSIPPEQLYEPGCYKSFLRQSMQGVLPEAIRRRPTKTRFIDFLDWVLREREAGMISALLSHPLSAELGFLDGNRLRESFSRYQRRATERDRSYLWYAITLEMWLRRLNRLQVLHAHRGRTTTKNLEVA